MPRVSPRAGMAPSIGRSVLVLAVSMVRHDVSISGASFRDIEPYAEVGGLDAALAGSLAQLIETLLAWRASLARLRTPAEWGERARALLAAFFDASEEGDRLTLIAPPGASAATPASFRRRRSPTGRGVRL